MQTIPRDWVEYWDNLDEGHLLFHPEAEEYVRNLTAQFPLDASHRILEFGCGYGFVAERLAPLVGQLALWDAAPRMRQFAAQLAMRRGNVSLLELQEEAKDTSLPRFDFILVNSVVQYMDTREFGEWLKRWRHWLGGGGKIIVSDLIRPDSSQLRDVVSLVTFSGRRGYLFKALRNVWAERGRYQRMAAVRPLYRPSWGEVERLSREAGLAVRSLERNLTHFTGRRTAVFTGQ